MAWTAPWTAVTGVVVTTAQLNQTRDNLLELRAGGFALASQAIGDLLYASSTTQWARLADVAAGRYLRSGGVGVAPLWSTLVLPNAATATYVTYAIGNNELGESSLFTFNAATQIANVGGSNGSGQNLISVTNTSDGAAAAAALQAIQSSEGSLSLEQLSASYTTSGIRVQRAGVIVTNGRGGLSIAATDATGVIRLYTGGTATRVTINSSGTQTWSAYGAGTATFDASGNITSVSDERLKTVLGVFTLGVPAIMGIRPIRYRYIAESGCDRTNIYAGFSAQNIMRFVPEAVGRNLAGLYSLNLITLVAVAVTAIQQLVAEVDELRAVAGLSAKNRLMDPVTDEARLIISPSPIS